MKRWSHTNHACTVCCAGVALISACMKSWYESASFTKRSPAAVTAIKPGLARSIKCGKCATLPSARGTNETGAKAAACFKSLATTAPTASAMRKPSPVLPREAAEKCALPCGSCGNNCCLRWLSCGKPPQANTTPHRACTCTLPSGVCNTAPVTRACVSLCIKDSAGLLTRKSTPAS